MTQTTSVLNVTGSTVISSSPGILCTVCPGAASCSFYDAATIAGAVAANLIVAFGAAVPPVKLDFPFRTGLTMTGTGPASVAYKG